jgi:ATP-dependent Clp protease adapter protein ClpS
MPVLAPEPEVMDPTRTDGGEWLVIVFDNDHNTWGQVKDILQQATGCTEAEAEMETWEVHHLGKSIVHHAERPECERVAQVIRTIGIRVEVEPV